MRKVSLYACILMMFSQEAKAQLILLEPESPKAHEITILGGLNFGSPTQRINGLDQHWIGNAAPAFGLLLGTQLFESRFDLESGVLFLSTQYEQNSNSVVITKKQESTHIPILIRFNFDQSVSLGFGGYLAYSRGTRDTTLTAGDQGLLISLKARFRLLTTLHLILDARYQHGLANMAILTSDLYNTRSVQILSGLALLF